MDLTPSLAVQAIGQSIHIAPDFPDVSLEPDVSFEEVLMELPLDPDEDRAAQPVAAGSTPKVASTWL
jgi:hypothetical protein